MMSAEMEVSPNSRTKSDPTHRSSDPTPTQLCYLDPSRPDPIHSYTKYQFTLLYMNFQQTTRKHLWTHKSKQTRQSCQYVAWATIVDDNDDDDTS